MRKNSTCKMQVDVDIRKNCKTKLIDYYGKMDIRNGTNQH